MILLFNYYTVASCHDLVKLCLFIVIFDTSDLFTSLFLVSYTPLMCFSWYCETSPPHEASYGLFVQEVMSHFLPMNLHYVVTDPQDLQASKVLRQISS